MLMSAAYVEHILAKNSVWLPRLQGLMTPAVLLLERQGGLQHQPGRRVHDQPQHCDPVALLLLFRTQSRTRSRIHLLLSSGECDPTMAAGRMWSLVVD